MPPKDAHEVIQKMMTIINEGITELPHSTVTRGYFEQSEN